MPITITLAGEGVECFELSLRKNKEWKARAAVVLAAEKQFAVPGADVADAYRGYTAFVDEHIEAMLGLVLDFLPDQSRRDHYAENATQTEILTAFFALAQLAFSTSFFLTMYGGAPTNG